MPKAPGDIRVRFVGFLDEIFAGPAWHGPALAGSLRGVTPRQAARRPAPGRHNIAEIVVHCAYWKNIVRHRLTGDADKVSDFQLAGANFFKRDRVTAASWKADRALLASEHRKLKAIARRLEPSTLFKRLPKSRWTPYTTIRGIIVHDAYHAGQIQLIKRLTKS